MNTENKVAIVTGARVASERHVLLIWRGLVIM